MYPPTVRPILLAALLLLGANPVHGQATDPHAGHVMPDGTVMDMPGMSHEGHTGHHALPAFLGPYPMSREASGTSWVPDATPHQGIHATCGAWSLMAHGFAMAVGDEQGGPRGDDKVYGASMLMGMATRPVGPGRLGLRSMVSLDPVTIGKEGYPLLLQTGETADGRTHLVDRQHPHDLFMELATTFSVSSGSRSAFLYGGLPGEPALGPPVFMHRPSGIDLPDAPISHHWLDSSHVTFGVVTAGVVSGGWKLEGSLFKGREPDQNRYDIESPKLDSRAARLSWNPTANWALQASRGRLTSPEQLAPEVDTDRTTVSALYGRAGRRSRFDATLAWGRNQNRPGRTLDAYLLETAFVMHERHHVFGRGEIAEKDELFEEGHPFEGRVFTVGKAEVGYLYDFLSASRVVVGAGATASLEFVPDRIGGEYGDAPGAGMLYLRAVLR